MATQVVPLVRKKLEIKGLEAITDEAFVKEAKSLLGYQVLSSAWIVRKALDALAKLGIEPFSAGSVDAYKAAQVKAVYSRRTRESRVSYNRVTTITRGEWVSTPLSGYKSEVPAFALLRAAEVKKALTKAHVACTFEIDELQTKTSRSSVRQNLDPFMVLVVQDRRIYIDVWNEPKFEGRRTV